MTAGLVALVMGVVVGAAALGGPAAANDVPQAQPDACAGVERWEADAQALADELAGASGADAEALRQELADAGFEAGGSPGGAGASPQPPPSGNRSWPDALVELVLAVIAALDGNGDGEVPVTVLDPSGAAPGATDADCADVPRADPDPRADPEPARPGRDEGSNGAPPTGSTRRPPAGDDPGESSGPGG
jgi:hypothetical protein